jgi:hypothetical protein
MGSRADEPDVPDDEQPLTAVVAALANQPVGTSWVEQKRARVLALAERVTTHGPLAEPVEIGWRVNRRLTRVGSALAALIAYRVFVWLLTLALALVLGLGLYSDATDTSPSDTVRRFGLGGYFASSVSQTASHGHGAGRWVALACVLLFLVYQTYVLVLSTAAPARRARERDIESEVRPDRDRAGPRAESGDWRPDRERARERFDTIDIAFLVGGQRGAGSETARDCHVGRMARIHRRGRRPI